MVTYCERIFDCCSCGGNDCGCGYCWDCNACDSCKYDEGICDFEKIEQCEPYCTCNDCDADGNNYRLNRVMNLYPKRYRPNEIKFKIVK